MKFISIGGTKAVLWEYRGNTYYLLFNGFAMFELYEKGGNNFMEKLIENNSESFALLVDAIKILSKYGEMARRHFGFDELPMFSENDVDDPMFISPGEIVELKNACLDAITLGYSREVKDEDEEIDLGLAELQKKRKNPEQNT